MGWSVFARLVPTLIGGMPKTWLIPAAGLALVAMTGAAGMKGYRMGDAASTARYEAIIARERAAAERRAKDLKRSAETVAQEVFDEQVATEARADALADAHGRLQHALAAIRRAARDAGTSPGADGSATLRELFGECADRYRDVAAAADRLRARVIGLQSYVRGVCLR